ncbi:hypothetical protein BOTBODRAFT_191302 [Botryobasidium botryosum FD-172 SS1]|uniref:C2 domain-containing protein n=1 Tax=Botryobasidium botryosum (strain FD-172 SS1) TaxID=930990 RepID=A0A067MBY6_BOTB1|nr:hypothetical protein BOTBODRAFT_191302 [Botryobasidium botryosum FD-172 SS1]
MAHSSVTTTSNITQSDAIGELRITVLGASNVPQFSLLDSKAFVTLRTPGHTWNTKVAERSRSPQWGEEFDLRGDNSSVLKIELKVLRRSGFSVSEQLVGAAEVRFEELRAKQRQAHEANGEYVAFDLQVASSSKPHPSIAIRVHRGLVAPKSVLDTAQTLASSAHDDIQRMRMGPTLPTVPAGASDAGSSAQDAIKSVGSAKEVKALYMTTLASVEGFVKMVDAFADIHPYVKAAWTILSAGYKIVMAQKDRDDALSELLESITVALNLICRFDKTALHKDNKYDILQVAKKTSECALFIKEYTSTESFVRRAAKGIFSNSGDEIARFKRDFDLLRTNIEAGAILSITEGLSKVNDELYGVEESVKLIRRDVDRVAQTVLIDKLPYAEGATWDPDRVCLSNTREALLEDIWQWIKYPDTCDGAKIFCLTGVAGSGKSAIAHTVAHRCNEEGLLTSSFFFSRDVAERNNPRKLLSTMARDLARDPHIRERISLAIESDQSLATAPLSRQFGPLIQEPCLRHPSDTPMVTVIDGVDEGCSPELLKLFRDNISKLPQSFRLFITSREMEAIEQYLSKSAHVHLRAIDLSAGANLGDIRTYVRCGFRDIATMHDLGESWPGEELMNQLSYMAGGLFQWISVILQALELSYDPVAELETLLAGLQTGLGAQEKMDEIYSKILQACDWNSLGFKRDYDLVMGAILAAKSPLSASALQMLHPTIPRINKLLSRLGALLTGWRHTNQPIRILHLSLRDFLTARVAKDAPFYICEKDHSRRLGLLSLAFLNDNLKHDTPGVGYLESDSQGVPSVSKSQISEELWYACEFWAAHILEIEAPAPAELVKLIRNFLPNRLISWIEACTSIDTFKGFQLIRTWIQSTFPEEIDLVNDEFNSRLGSTLVNISTRLAYMDRREEALLAIQEAVTLYRQLAEDSPTTFNPDFARSLNYFSIRLSDLGERKDALAASRECVALLRPLAEDCPPTFNPTLAHSLNNLSIRLSDLGQQEDGLAAVQESVALYRQLVEDHPSAFKSDLAHSLITFSNRLLALGRREDAIAAIRESVVLHRQLAEDRPAAFNLNLALSLSNFSNRLTALGQRGEALAAIQESVALYRQLAENRLLTNNSDLAHSLNSLSNCLSALGKREDALTAIQESVALHRQLAEGHLIAFDSDLARSLNSLSVQLAYLGKREDALAATQESMALYRRLAQDRPAAFNADLARSLYNLSLRLSELALHEDALEAAKEAVELRRPLANDIPAVFKSRLAKALRQLSTCLRHLSQEEAAAAAEQEANMLDPPKAPTA